MDTSTLLLLGAAGGTVRGAVHAYDCMIEWLHRRRQYLLAPDPEAEGPPAFSTYYDVAGECIAALVHILLGAGVAALLGSSGQLNGGFAVFAAGASAPLVLVQLKSSRLAEAILGDVSAAATIRQPAGAANEQMPESSSGIRAPEPAADMGLSRASNGSGTPRSQRSAGLGGQAADQEGAV
ncbi:MULTISPECIES: hypothetical protein [Streptomyces]|uniref:hypothetical protein n=1 Tax=Streptomyces TaxID=1883 RepID=UPI0031ED9DF4